MTPSAWEKPNAVASLALIQNDNRFMDGELVKTQKIPKLHSTCEKKVPVLICTVLLHYSVAKKKKQEPTLPLHREWHAGCPPSSHYVESFFFFFVSFPLS